MLLGHYLSRRRAGRGFVLGSGVIAGRSARHRQASGADLRHLFVVIAVFGGLRRGMTPDGIQQFG